MMSSPTSVSLINPVLDGSAPLHVSLPAITAKSTWGPVLAPRMSNRTRRDGRNAIQKAANLKKVKNLEIPKSGDAA